MQSFKTEKLTFQSDTSLEQINHINEHKYFLLMCPFRDNIFADNCTLTDRQCRITSVSRSDHGLKSLNALFSQLHIKGLSKKTAFFIPPNPYDVIIH